MFRVVNTPILTLPLPQWIIVVTLTLTLTVFEESENNEWMIKWIIKEEKREKERNNIEMKWNEMNDKKGFENK